MTPLRFWIFQAPLVLPVASKRSVTFMGCS
jgi:hypothetical protein